MKKKLIALLVAMAMIMVPLTACSGGGGDESGEATETSEAAVKQLVVQVGPNPETLDPALNSAVDGATMLVHLFSGLAKWEQNSSGALEIVADAATELPEGVENADGTVTYTYTLRDGLKWSDGKDLKASDFVFACKSARPTIHQS